MNIILFISKENEINVRPYTYYLPNTPYVPSSKHFDVY